MRFRKKSTTGKAVSESLLLDASGSTDTGTESIQLDISAMKNNKSYSLGVGQVSANGTVSFQAAPPRSICTTESLSSTEHDGNVKARFRGSKSSSAKKLRKMLSAEKILSPMRDTLSTASQLSDKLLRPVNFERVKSCYLRVADLQMSETSHSAASEHEEIVPNFHHASVLPPPGMEHDPNEMWVAIDTGEGSHAPIAPMAVKALAEFGKRSAMDSSMWTPDRKTEKLIKAGDGAAWYSCVWNEAGPLVLPPQGFAEENDVMVWTGEFQHGLFGSDIPCVRAAGIINMSAKSLTELLLDSNRVKEYNEMSLGRTDLMVMPGNLEEDGPFGKSVTKVMKSESRRVSKVK